ncbi:MAG: hypothetical protein ACRDRP_23660 [Pseudonocardiaceae bacterium]
MRAYLEAALVLVAKHRDQGVVGGLIAYPPISVAEQVVDGVQHKETAKTAASECFRW